MPRPPASVAERRARHEQDRREHAEQRDRRSEVRLQDQQPGEDAGEQPDRPPELAEASRRRPPGEVGRGPDREGQLCELGRLEDCRAERQPPARAVDRVPDHEHRDEQAERDEYERRSEQAQPPVVPPLRDHHQADPERRVQALALEVVVRVLPPTSAAAEVAEYTMTSPNATRARVTRISTLDSSSPRFIRTGFAWER